MREMKTVTEEDMKALPWGSVVCEADGDGHTLYMKIGQSGYEYWAEAGVEGPSYPGWFGTVYLWYNPVAENEILAKAWDEGHQAQRVLTRPPEARGKHAIGILESLKNNPYRAEQS